MVFVMFLQGFFFLLSLHSSSLWCCLQGFPVLVSAHFSCWWCCLRPFLVPLLANFACLRCCLRGFLAPLLANSSCSWCCLWEFSRPCIGHSSGLRCTESEFSEIVEGLKDKPCHISICPVKELKKLNKIISLFLTKIVNRSLLMGQFPSLLKTARVVPMYKCGIRKE